MPKGKHAGLYDPSFSGKNTDWVYEKILKKVKRNIIDIGDNCQSAITGAKKRAINRLTGIGDDIYGKRVEEEGAGSAEEIIMTTSAGSAIGRDMFMRYISDKHILPSELLKILGVSNIGEISDWAEALKKVKEVKG